jgi:hypothetical protein
VRFAVTDTIALPEPASRLGVFEPSADVVPYSKWYAVALPDGLTVPLTIAVADATLDACPVEAAGAGGAGDAAVVVVLADVVVVGVARTLLCVVVPGFVPEGCPADAACPLEEELELELEAFAEPAFVVSGTVAEVDPVGGHLSDRSVASCCFAVVTACSSVESCNLAVATADCAWSRLEAFDAFSAAVGPPCAVASALSAWARFACAAASEVSAVVGSIVARICPDVTWSPTLTFTAVTVPLVPKSAEAEFVADTLPDAVTLDCTVPVVTVAVRWVPVLAIEPPVNPYTALRAKKTTAQAPASAIRYAILEFLRR